MANAKKIESHPMGGTDDRRRLGVAYPLIPGWRIAVPVLLAGSALAGPSDAPSTLSISEKSFRCMTEMTHIAPFYVDNLVGNLPGTVQEAESPTRGGYPVGSAVQLVSTEVMVRVQKGFNTAT